MAAPPKPEKDEPVKVPLDPEAALRALLRVKPDDEAAPVRTEHPPKGQG